MPFTAPILLLLKEIRIDKYVAYYVVIVRLLTWIFLSLGLNWGGNAQSNQNSLFVERIPGFHSRVHGIVKDKQGFLWVADDVGIHRYNGREFEKVNYLFTNEPNVAVWGLYLDSLNRIWINSRQGFKIIDREHSKVIDTDIPWHRFLHFARDTLLIIRDFDFLVFNMIDSTTRQIDLIDFVSERIKGIWQNDAGEWLVQHEKGIIHLNKNFEFIRNEPVKVEELYWKKYVPGAPEYWNFRIGRNWGSVKDNDGNIWMIHSYRGLLRFNPDGEKIGTLFLETSDEFGIPDNINKLHYDSGEDIIWLGTFHGLCKIVRHKQFFEVEPLEDKTYPVFINHRAIMREFSQAIYQDFKGDFWFRSETNLFKTGQVNHEAYIRTAKDYRFFMDYQGKNMCFGEYSSSGELCLLKYSIETEELKFIPLAFKPKEPNDLQKRKFINETEFFGAWQNKWAVIMSVKDSVRILKNHEQLFPEKYDDLECYWFRNDCNGTTWAVTNKGIFYLDIEQLEFVLVPGFEEARKEWMWDLASDGPDVTWMITDKAFWKVDMKTNESRSYPYDQTHGVRGVLVDDLGNPWGIYYNGMMRLDVETLKITYFENGKDWKFTSAGNPPFLKGRDGKFYFEGQNLLISIDPADFQLIDDPLDVFVTQLVIGNDPIDSMNNKYNAGPGFKSLELEHYQNTLIFQLGSTNHQHSEDNQYYYRLSGEDNKWNHLVSHSKGIYHKLSPGEYTLELKMENSFYQNEAYSKIDFVIKTPFWDTGLALFLKVLFIGVILYVTIAEIFRRRHLLLDLEHNKRSTEHLKEVNALKSNFYANISHEFRTPLTLIKGPIDQRLSRATSNEDREEFGLIKRSTDRLLNLVNQLLDLSKVEGKMMKLRCRFGDINRLLIVIASQFSSVALSKSILFEKELEEEVNMFYDEDMVQKIISNLLSNAFKFTSTGGHIKLKSKKSGPSEEFKEGCFEIKVTDSGPGIDPQDLDKIFDRFYQADDSAGRRHEGSGIGLALTKELVELHQGRISVSSISGVGTSFMVRLPLGSAHLESDDVVTAYDNNEKQQEIKSTQLAYNYEPVQTPSMDGNSETNAPVVLIVEDNADLRLYISKQLMEEFEVLLAEDGQIGYDRAVETVPDLIITDLMMPNMDGVELCKACKHDERTSHIPIIMLTAKAEQADRIEGFEVGADAYIEKPFDMSELKIRVDNLIKMRNLLHNKYAGIKIIKPSDIRTESQDDNFIKKVAETIEGGMSESSFSVEQLANQMNLSQIQLYRKLKALTNHSPNELIREFRLERAASLLKQNAGNVSEIAFRVGFENLSYFSKCFRDKYEMTPKKYLEIHLTKADS
ncbi:ATP-binding protein [Marinoscillum sp. MHG1-6]|uniref:hybrid sensor histidine kinase/response regulator transcription factor n=1 Tax=Marinoscillum sp. MHG1-6 TaxID=2959627 RepID=UPI002157CCB6|nr:ATP-binding protein [Marinoscillum sp. MHG1-6]